MLSFFSLYNIYKIKVCENELDRINDKVQKKEKLIETLGKNLIIQYKSENSKIYDKIMLIDNKGKEHRYKSLTNKKKIVIRVVSSSCNACLEDQIKNIHFQLNKYNISKKIFIFSNVDNYREFLTLIKFLKIPAEKCYFLRHPELLNIHVEKYKPFLYMYIAEPKKNIDNVFVPLLNKPDLTNDYLLYTKNLIN